MDALLSVALPAQGWTGNRIRIILAGENGREVWEITLDRLAGTGKAQVVGPLALYKETPEIRATLADEPVPAHAEDDATAEGVSAEDREEDSV